MGCPAARSRNAVVTKSRSYKSICSIVVPQPMVWLRYNFNSLFPAPQRLGQFYLSAFLATLRRFYSQLLLGAAWQRLSLHRERLKQMHTVQGAGVQHLCCPGAPPQTFTRRRVHQQCAVPVVHAGPGAAQQPLPSSVPLHSKFVGGKPRLRKPCTLHKIMSAAQPETDRIRVISDVSHA